MSGWLSIWDILLLVAVPLQAVAIAYCYLPKAKGLIISLPIPFTIAVMAIGQGVNVDNVVGLLLSFVYAHIVRLLYQKAKLNIIVTIVLAAVGYCLAGILLSGVLPRTSSVFWLAIAGITIVATAAWFLTPHRDEPGNRSPLPLYVKFPIIFMIVLGLLIAKKWMGGFMAMFPMMGVITSYEARSCLWSICRQMSVVVLSLICLLSVTWGLQGRFGIGLALAAGWLALLLSLILLMKITWKQKDRKTVEPEKRMEITNAI